MASIRSVNEVDKTIGIRKRGLLKQGLLSPQQQRLIALTVLSIVYWLLIATFPGLGGLLTAGLVGFCTLFMIPWFGKGNHVLGFACIAYLAVLQPAIRLYGTFLPYNVLEYLIPFWLILFIGKRKNRLYATGPLLLFGAYLFLELAGFIQTESFTYGRAVFVPSMVLFCFIFMAAQNSLQREELEQILHGYLIGALTLAGLMGRIVFFDETVQWATESNFAASGGMGPNQIAFLMATAIFFVLILSEYRSSSGRTIYFLIAGVLVYLMILTFARGGLYLLALVVVSYYLIFRRPTIRSFLTIFVLAGLVWVVFSLGVERTGGAIVERYNDTDTSRVVLARQGLQIFAENPIWGVGTGNYYIAISAEDLFGSQSGAHNELVRAAAEHGIFGLTAWLVFLAGSLIHAWHYSPPDKRALRMALIVLAFASMLYNGLKLVSQSFVLFLALSAYTLPNSHRIAHRLATHQKNRLRLNGKQDDLTTLQ